MSKLDLVGKDPEKLKDDPAYSALFRNFFLMLNPDGSVRYSHSPYPNDDGWKEFRHGRNWPGRPFMDDGYVFSFSPLPDGGVFVSMVFASYPNEEFARDVAEYAAFVLFLSVFIFFVVGRFVAYVLKPVEENVKTMKYFVSVAGHELKTPLASISSGAQLLSETKAYDEETVRDIANETKKAGELIASLAELSSMSERAPKGEVHISETVYEALRGMDADIRKKKIEVKTELVEDVTVSANRYYAFILVSNLLSNAVKYDREGGEMRIAIGNGKLTVSDTGVGIPKSQIAKIFDAFHRVSLHRERSEGLGLGLALVKKIATLYGWRISVRSEEGKGSEFEVRFNS